MEMRFQKTRGPIDPVRANSFALDDRKETRCWTNEFAPTAESEPAPTVNTGKPITGKQDHATAPPSSLTMVLTPVNWTTPSPKLPPTGLVTSR